MQPHRYQARCEDPLNPGIDTETTIFQSQRPDLVVLDIGIPKIDGFEVCRRIKAHARAPVIIVTARDADAEEVLETFGVGGLGKPMCLDTEYDSVDGDDTFTVLDYVGSADPEMETLPERLDLSRAVGYLDEREKTIIYMYYYKGVSQTVIARKLAMSQIHVSRLQRGALDKLEQVLSG